MRGDVTDGDVQDGAARDAPAARRRRGVMASLDPTAVFASLLVPTQILFVNLLLSADNALVIAMACRGLPAEDVQRATIIGITGAIVVAARAWARSPIYLLRAPLLQIAAGVVLLWIAVRLTLIDAAGLEEDARRAGGSEPVGVLAAGPGDRRRRRRHEPRQCRGDRGHRPGQRRLYRNRPRPLHSHADLGEQPHPRIARQERASRARLGRDPRLGRGRRGGRRSARRAADRGLCAGPALRDPGGLRDLRRLAEFHPRSPPRAPRGRHAD